MKQVVFIASHLCSGSFDLVNILNDNPRVQISTIGATYSHMDNLDALFSIGHKLNNSAAIYGDHLLFNMCLSSKSLYKRAKFIYFIREAAPTLNGILLHPGTKYTQETAHRYYCYRLRRICEMAKRTPGAVLLTWEDAASSRGFPIIEKYLGLKDELTPKFGVFPNLKHADKADKDLVASAQESYERHLYYLKQLDLKKTDDS